MAFLLMQLEYIWRKIIFRSSVTPYQLFTIVLIGFWNKTEMLRFIEDLDRLGLSGYFLSNAHYIS